jgi:hypothetical protein
VPTYGIIYLIRDKTNGKVYIGRTTQALAMRWAGHVHDSKRNVVTGLLGAIKRNGVDAFTIEELERHPDKGSLMLAERAAIERYRATDPNVGYNIMAGSKDGGDAYTGFGKDGQVLQTHVLRIRMTERLHTELTQCAVAHGQTLSEWARMLLIQAMRGWTSTGGSSSTEVVTSSPTVTSSSPVDDLDSSSSETATPLPVSDDLSWLDKIEFDVGV